MAQVHNLVTKVLCKDFETKDGTTTTPKNGHTVRFHRKMHFRTHYRFCYGVNTAAPDC